MRTVIEIVIAVLLAYIAYQNYRINLSNSRVQKDKLRLDLFDRRHRIFRACQELFSTVVRDGTLTQVELFKFSADSSDSEFLFGSEIKDYINEIYKKGCKLIYLRERLDSRSLGIGEERSKLAHENSELLGWFGDQFDISRNKFRKYLHFTIYKFD